MIEVNAVDYCEDEKYDSCGNTTKAILKVNGIKIPLCGNCMDELTQSLEEFNNTIFCYKCGKFVMSESGWNYGGSCTKDRDIDSKNAGYIYCVDCMHTCKDAVPKNDANN